MKNLRYISMLFVLLPIADVAVADVRWEKAAYGQTSSNPVPGGREPAGISFVCRDHAGVPGKLISGKCYVTLGGNEFENNQYEVLSMMPGTYEWVRYAGNLPQKAILGGSEGRGKKVYICRTVASGLSQNTFIGKFIPWLSDCYYGLGGKEKVTKIFDVLIEKTRY